MEKQVCPQCGRCTYLGEGAAGEAVYNCSVHGNVTPKTTFFVTLDFPACSQCGGSLEARLEGDPVQQRIFCEKDGEVTLHATRPNPSPGMAFARFTRDMMPPG
jgi:hypothetical protein